MNRTPSPLTRIQTGRTFGFIWHAHACEGSTVRRTLLGLTERHAKARAGHWIRVNA